MFDLDKFRADFALVWRHWRDTGQLTEHEMREQMAEAGAAVKRHMNDPEWMACAASHYAQMADEIRRDRSRSERIAAEVREEQKVAA